ncbi:hypothetical protein [Quadrisphaera sp. KR29]|uniref:hypothetical protein n=1 Tax=Quadrisphaera sp. KR29 TaxID=3461391 RepID=UPI004043B0F4
MTSTAVDPGPGAPVPASAPAAPSAPPAGVRFGSTRRGLRVAWLPSEGPVRARLAFRVGTADEGLPERGLTHLVAHLAHRFTEVGQEAGGGRRPSEPWHAPCTSPLEVAFVATGTDEEVRDHLVAVCEGLASLAEVLPEKLAHEAGCAERESLLHLPTSWDLLRTTRHGSTGWGHRAAPELALATADATAVTGWVERWFTASNAVLAVRGPQPPAWVLPLLSGSPSPAPRPAEQELSTPAVVAGPPGVVAVSALAQDSAALRAGWWWLRHLVAEELGARVPGPADVEVQVTAVGGGAVELCLALSASAEAGQEALHAVQEATARACSEPPPAEELARWAASLVPLGATAALEELAGAWLLSGEVEPPTAAPGELLRAQAGGVRPAAVAQALREALGTGLLQVPRDVEAPAGVPLAGPPAAPEPTGGTWVSTRGAGRLVVGAEGVLLQHEDGTTDGAAWDRAAAVVHLPGGARVVLDACGAEVVVDPTAWVGGDAAVEALDAHAPSPLVVVLPDGRPDAAVPARQSRAGLHRLLGAARSLAVPRRGGPRRSGA